MGWGVGVVIVPGSVAATKLKGGGGVARGAGRIVDVACVDN